MIRAIVEFLKELLSFFTKVKEDKKIKDVKVEKQEVINRKDDNEKLVEKASKDPIALEEIRRRLGE